MSVVVHFSPDLSAWLVGHLDAGRPPSSLVQEMVDEHMEPEVARAIVDAFVTARRTAKPLPKDSVTVEEEALAYAYDIPILRPGALIQTFDRAVRVAARAEKPVMAMLSDVVSRDECAEIIELARPRLKASTVVEPETGRNVVAEHRTSLGMFFGLGENALIARLDRRISEVMNLPVSHGEGFQVLHYPTGTATTPHHDFLKTTNAANRASIARSGQRVSTLIVYLNDVEEGGETVFPAAGWSVVPERGNAVYFEYCNRLGQVDARSLHGGNPVARGEKWVLTKWMRQREFVSAGGASSGR